jgi:hypothetical protein
VFKSWWLYSINNNTVIRICDYDDNNENWIRYLLNSLSLFLFWESKQLDRNCIYMWLVYWLFAYNLYSKYVCVYESVFVSIRKSQGPSSFSPSLSLFYLLQFQYWPSTDDDAREIKRTLTFLNGKSQAVLLPLYYVRELINEHYYFINRWI